MAYLTFQQYLLKKILAIALYRLLQLPPINYRNNANGNAVRLGIG